MDSPRSPIAAFGVRGNLRIHLVHALLEAFGFGILANAPVVALKSLGSPPWQLALSFAPSCLGIVLDLQLGGRMAQRAKLPYMQGAIFGSALAVIAMRWTGSSLAFNLLHGIALLSQVVARMAFAPVLRSIYPPECRGAVTGSVKRWSSLAFLVGALLAALILDAKASDQDRLRWAQALLGVAALTLFASGFVVGRLRCSEMRSSGAEEHQSAEAWRHALRILREDRRFRGYVLVALLAALGSLTTAPFLSAFFARELAMGYLATLTLTQLVPQFGGFVTTGAWGRLADRINPWQVWAWLRGGWGISLLLLAIASVAVDGFPLAVLPLAILSRVVFGCVMGGSWILYWQVGVAHFAPVGAETSRYMSLLAMSSALARLIGPSLGTLCLVASGSTTVVFLFGGILLLIASALSRRAGQREKGEERFRTIANFESKTRSES